MIPIVWFWVAVVLLMCMAFLAFWLWVQVGYWQDHCKRLKTLIQRDRLMYRAGAKPREVGKATLEAIDRDAKTFAAEVKLGRVRFEEE